MKRLVFCFDGSWNRLDAPYPTNVLLTAESVLPMGEGGQITFYDEGVGREEGDAFVGGVFGAGVQPLLAIHPAFTRWGVSICRPTLSVSELDSR